MRSKAINYLKCIATLLVINTHLTTLYPSRLGFLAWGGYFANSIFFFVSGYCLTNVNLTFPKWYWKRFVRVYAPYVVILPFLFFAGSLNGWNWINIVMPFDAYHFIPTILFLYCVFFFLTKLQQKTIIGYGKQCLFFAAIALFYFVFWFDKEHEHILQHFTLIEMISYLIPMLLGGLAKRGKKINNKVICICMVVFAFSVYFYQSLRPFTGFLKILQPCIGISFAYGFACFFLLIEKKLPSVRLIDYISAITLDCYLVQFISLKAFTGIGFPTNIIYHVICSLATANCLHIVSDYIVTKITVRNTSMINK